MGQTGGKLLLGFVVLHVLCCGAVLLGGASALAAAGGLLGQPLLIAGGALLLTVAVGLAVRRAPAATGPGCPVEPSSAQQPAVDRA